MSSHCIPDGCSEVVFQEYLPSVVRWRYGTEPWQEIIGADNFTTEVVTNTNLNTGYQVVYETPIISNGILQGWTNNQFKVGIGTWNGIQSWRMRYIKSNGTVTYQNPYSPYLESNNVPIGQRNIQVWIEITSQRVTTNHFISGGAFGFWALRVQPTTVSLQTTNCIFKVYKQGVIVHQETRSTCPQVEKIACSLNPQAKKIEIKKLPYIEKIEVVPYQYSAYRLPGVPAPIVQADPIPPECLNIYNNSIYVVPPSGQGIYPNATPFDSLVAQICSSPGCPPPVYDVLCDSCGCESCPGDTCPVVCNGVICCYNDYGVSVKEISLADYCGGQP